MREYLLCLALAAAVTYLLTPLVRRFAVAVDAIADVRDRDVHKAPMPRLGGLAMLLGMLAAFALASTLPFLGRLYDDSGPIRGLVLGAGVLAILGYFDDRIGLDAPAKLAGQVMAGIVVALNGVQLYWLPLGGGALSLDPTTSVLITVFAIVVVINAVNFVDGLDGLAASVGGIAALAFGAYSYQLSVVYGFDRATLAGLVAAVLAGICFGFLPHNWNPARLFMGDTGSMIIGLLLAASSITLTGQVDPTALSTVELLPAALPLLLPVIIIALPLLDMALAVIRRTRAGLNPFQADKLHLHHRLLQRGHSHRRAVLVMDVWATLVAVAAVGVAFLPTERYLMVVGGLLLVCVVATLWRPSHHSGRRGVAG